MLLKQYLTTDYKLNYNADINKENRLITILVLVVLKPFPFFNFFFSLPLPYITINFRYDRQLFRKKYIKWNGIITYDHKVNYISCQTQWK